MSLGLFPMIWLMTYSSVKVWCHEAASHSLNQCRPKSTMAYGITKSWCVCLLEIKYLNQYAASLICCYYRGSLLKWLITTKATKKSEAEIQSITRKSLKLSSKQTINVDIHTIFIGSASTCSTVNNAWQLHQSSIRWVCNKIAAILQTISWNHFPWRKSAIVKCLWNLSPRIQITIIQY